MTQEGKKVIATWRTSGKDFLILYLHMDGVYSYSGNCCGGVLPTLGNDEEAIEYMGEHAVTVLRSDKPSLKRIPA